MPIEKSLTATKTNGDDNVVPFVNPNEKPWYETDEGKKLIAKSDRAELISILGGS